MDPGVAAVVGAAVGGGVAAVVSMGVEAWRSRRELHSRVFYEGRDSCLLTLSVTSALIDAKQYGERGDAISSAAFEAIRNLYRISLRAIQTSDADRLVSELETLSSVEDDQALETVWRADHLVRSTSLPVAGELDAAMAGIPHASLVAEHRSLKDLEAEAGARFAEGVSSLRDAWPAVELFGTRSVQGAALRLMNAAEAGASSDILLALRHELLDVMRRDQFHVDRRVRAGNPHRSLMS